MLVIKIAVIFISHKSVRLCQPHNVKVIAWKPIKKIKPPVGNLPSEIKYFNGGKIFLKLSNNVKKLKELPFTYNKVMNVV